MSLEQRSRATLDSPSYVGVNIGALTVKIVLLRGEAVHSWTALHQGRPLAVLEEMLAHEEIGAERFVGVSGHLGHITEVGAIQRALEELPESYDAVASLGGESFLVYALRGKRILSVLSHNKCAAGSGEFFVQQIGRMGLGMEEAIERSSSGKEVPLASRCSVHCKSDITHKLNRGEASIEDILYTLHESMADKVAALLEKTQQPLRRVLLIGGVSKNSALVAALRRKLPESEIAVLPESACFEALGAALLTRDAPRFSTPQVALNPAVGHAFAYLVGRDVVIPPSPELLGAQGVAVLALERRRGAADRAVDLLALAEPGMELLGRFTARPASSIAPSIASRSRAGDFPSGEGAVSTSTCGRGGLAPTRRSISSRSAGSCSSRERPRALPRTERRAEPGATVASSRPKTSTWTTPPPSSGCWTCPCSGWAWVSTLAGTDRPQ